MPFILRSEEDEQNPTLTRLYGIGIGTGRLYYYRKNAVGTRTGFISLIAQGARDEDDDGNEGIVKVTYAGHELPEFGADGSRNWKHHRGRITKHPVHKHVTAVDAGGNAFTVPAHGYATDTAVEVFTRNGTNPTPLVEGVTYYAINNGTDSVSLAAAPGGAAIDLGAYTGGQVFIFANAGVGFNDPDQGALHFFPDLRWTGSGFDFIEVLLPTELSDGEDEPSRMKVITRGKRVRSYTRSGVELVPGPHVYSTNNDLVALDILTGDAKLRLSRIHAPSHLDEFVPRCDGLLPWEGGNEGTDPTIWVVRSNFDALDHAGLVKSTATAWDARAATSGFPADTEIKIEVKAGLGTFGVGFHTTQFPTTPDDMVFSLQPNAVVNQITQKGSGVSNVMTNWQPNDTLVLEIKRDAGGALFFTASQNGNALPLASVPAVPNATLYVCVVGFHQAAGITSSVITPAGTAAVPRQVKRFDAQIHFADATAVQTAVAAVMFRAPGCDMQDVNGRLKALTVPNRTPVMTLRYDPNDPAHTNILDFSVYRRSNHLKPNFYVGTFRNSDDELLRRGAPVTAEREKLQKKVGRPIVANAGNMGVATQSLTRRILETQARLLSDMDGFYIVEVTLEAHKLAVGDFCYLAEKAVAYSNADPTLCWVLQEIYIFTSPFRKRFLLQAINPAFYSDSDQGAITALIRSRSVSPFQPPPAVDSLMLSVDAQLQPDNSYLLTISGAVQFAAFNRQHAVVLWKRPSSGVFEATDILLTPVSPSFVITGVEAGVHTFRVITQTPTGVQSLTYIEEDVTAVPPEVPPASNLIIEDETTPTFTLAFASQSTPGLTADRRLVFNVANADRTLQVAELEAFGNLGNGPGYIKKTGDNAYALTFPSFAEVTGSLAVAQLPAMAGGDVTSPAGSNVLSIGNGRVTFAMIASAAVSDDATLSGASATKLVTERAAKLYADSLVVGLVDDRGQHDASGNVFPSSGGSGPAGAINKGDLWFVSAAGVLGGQAVNIGDQVRAMADAPGQTAANWAISEANIGYVPENVANKATDFSVINNTRYPSTQAIQNWAGSTNLTTLGTIATGVWNGTALDIPYVVTSSNPGAAQKILATNTSGHLQLVRLGIGIAPTQALEVNGNIFISASPANLYLKDVNTGFQAAATQVVTLQANNALRTGNFTSGLVGWTWNASGDGEANNLTLRGALRSAVLLYNAQLATAGTQLITPSAGKLRTDFAVPAAPTYGTTTVTIDIVDQDGLTHAASQLFVVNDILYLKDGLTGYGFFKVTAVSDQSTFWRYTASIQAGSANVTYHAGLGVSDYKQANAGAIVLTADQAGAPFIQMYTHDGTFTALSAVGTLNVTPQLRIGNLNGSYGFASNVYGFGTGQYNTASKAWVTVEQANGFRIGVQAAVLGQWDTSGNVTVGSTSSNKGNVYISAAGVLSVRRGTTDYITLSATDAQFTNLIKITGTSAAISVGATPPTSATVGTGIWFDRTGLYGLNENVQNFFLNATNGQITMKAGLIGGWTIESTRISSTNVFIDNAGNYVSFGAPPPTSFLGATGIWIGVQSSLNEGLVSFWNLGEASGARVDSAGSNHLTDNNTVTQAAGKIGNAAQFTAANAEYLSIADNAELSTGNIDFSVSCWVRMDSKPTYSDILCKGSTNTGAQVEYLIDYESGADRFKFYVGDGSLLGSVTANSLGSPSISTWYFIVVWHDASANTINIQINNGTVDSASWTTGVQNGSGPFVLGRGGSLDGEYWNGRIDAVGFWKRVLTASERAALYNSFSGVEHPFIAPAQMHVGTVSSGVLTKGFSWDGSTFQIVDGVLTLGALRLDPTNGITITSGSSSTSFLTWKDGASVVGMMYVYKPANDTLGVIEIRADAGNRNATFGLKAQNQDGTHNASFYLYGNGSSSGAYALLYGGNSFKGLSIGANTPPAASAILDLNPFIPGALLLSRMTSIQRDGLTPSNGMVIYNTNTNKLQGRAGGAWVDLH